MLLHNLSDTSVSGDEGVWFPHEKKNSGGYEFRQGAPRLVVSFSSEDPDNPTNWSKVISKDLYIALSSSLKLFMIEKETFH